jgi:hypothetical protein
VPGGYHKNRNRDLMVIRVALRVHTHSSRNMKDWVSGIEPQFWRFFLKQKITTYRTGGSFMKTGSSLRFLK